MSYKVSLGFEPKKGLLDAVVAVADKEYKISLGQISDVSSIILKVARDLAELLPHGQTIIASELFIDPNDIEGIKDSFSLKG